MGVRNLRQGALCPPVRSLAENFFVPEASTLLLLCLLLYCTLLCLMVFVILTFQLFYFPIYQYIIAISNLNFSFPPLIVHRQQQVVLKFQQRVLYPQTPPSGKIYLYLTRVLYQSQNVEIKNTIRYCEVLALGIKISPLGGVQGRRAPQCTFGTP